MGGNLSVERPTSSLSPTSRHQIYLMRLTKRQFTVVSCLSPISDELFAHGFNNGADDVRQVN